MFGTFKHYGYRRVGFLPGVLLSRHLVTRRLAKPERCGR